MRLAIVGAAAAAAVGGALAVSPLTVTTSVKMPSGTCVAGQQCDRLENVLMPNTAAPGQTVPLTGPAPASPSPGPAPKPVANSVPGAGVPGVAGTPSGSAGSVPGTSALPATSAPGGGAPGAGAPGEPIAPYLPIDGSDPYDPYSILNATGIPNAVGGAAAIYAAPPTALGMPVALSIEYGS